MERITRYRQIQEILKKQIQLGKYEVGDYLPSENELHAGDSYAIPGNTPLSFEIIESGEVVDVFTPQREDYL